MDSDEGEGWGEFSSNGDANEDDDDTSWKVRRAAVKSIEAIINSRPEMLKQIYNDVARQLVSRFKERDDNVKQNIFEAFQTLL
jgi:cullin-associated NEDD8-dissociated protein 1